MKNTYNVAYLTKAGKRHRSLRKPNEDYVAIFEDENIVSIAVADGCSQSNHALLAAELTCEAAIEFAKMPKIWKMKPKNLKGTLLSMLDKTYLNATISYAELCATLSVVVINKITNNYIAINIGDSQIIQFDADFQPQLLIDAVNILGNKNRTVFANSELASKFMTIRLDSMENIAGFIVISDGAEKITNLEYVSNLEQLASATVLSTSSADIELNKLFEELANDTNDDISIASVMLDTQETLEIARELYHGEVIDNNKMDILYNFECDDDNTFFIPAEGANFNDDEVVNVNVTESINEYKEPTLLEFLSTSKTPSEIVTAGFTSEISLLTYLSPYLRDKLVVYKNGKFERGSII